MPRASSAVFTVFICLMFLPGCRGNAKLYIRFDSFSNPNQLKYDGSCCDGERRGLNCTDTCDYILQVCLGTSPKFPCDIKNFDAGAVNLAMSGGITFPAGWSNPLPFDIDTWQGSVQVTVTMLDQDTSMREVVDTFSYSFNRPQPYRNGVPGFGNYSIVTASGQRNVERTSFVFGLGLTCDRFYYADNCSVNCVETDDCNGHYTCDTVTGQKICKKGWGGEVCNTQLSNDHGCAVDQQQVCEHSSTCVPYGEGQYYCCCSKGYTGNNCETEITTLDPFLGCRSQPCLNNGRCLEGGNGTYQCQCSDRYKGDNCEQARTCQENPCRNGGQCVPQVSGTTQTFYCACLPFFTGDLCETITPTAGSPTSSSPMAAATTLATTTGGVIAGECYSQPCQNSGQCQNGSVPGTFSCLCSDRFKGAYCEQTRTCSDNPCQNSGQCLRQQSGNYETFYCACNQPFTGDLCESPLATAATATTTSSSSASTSSSSSSLSASATATTTANVTSTAATTTLTMETTITPVLDYGFCVSQPCANKGLCKAGLQNGTYYCLCGSRYKGAKCEESRTCSDNPCQNSYNCTELSSGASQTFYCSCLPSYTGDVCEVPLNATPSPTPTATLFNGTTSGSVVITASGQCPENYYGPQCSVYCRPADDCSGHFGCEVATGRQLCLNGWRGTNCTVRTELESSCLCKNGGQCVGGGCCCPAGFAGELCEQKTPSTPWCNEGSCLNEGTCVEEPSGYSCSCPPGFTGSQCEFRVCPENSYGRDCSVSCRAQESCEGGQYTCNPLTGQKLCRYGWLGDNCDVRDPQAQHLVACPYSVCRNGGRCVNTTCCCPPGFMGSLCHIEVLECATQPCLNGGRCVDLIADYVCRCRNQFTGKNCETPPPVSGQATSTIASPATDDPCRNVTCLNSGICTRARGGSDPVCLCPAGVYGDRCQSTVGQLTTTQDPKGQQCENDYFGPGCKVHCREADNCAEGHYYCDQRTGLRVCRSGWGGVNCTERLVSPDFDPECPSRGCLHDGACFRGTCCCREGYKGDRCQEEQLPCQSSPCLHGNCRDQVGTFQCDCDPGYNGTLCQTFVGDSSPDTTAATTRENTSSTTDTVVCGTVKCYNGASCGIRSDSTSFCVCSPEWQGLSCLLPQNPRTTTLPSVSDVTNLTSTVTSALTSFTFASASSRATTLPPDTVTSTSAVDATATSQTVTTPTSNTANATTSSSVTVAYSDNTTIVSEVTNGSPTDNVTTTSGAAPSHGYVSVTSDSATPTTTTFPTSVTVRQSDVTPVLLNITTAIPHDLTSELYSSTTFMTSLGATSPSAGSPTSGLSTDVTAQPASSATSVPVTSSTVSLASTLSSLTSATSASDTSTPLNVSTPELFSNTTSPSPVDVTAVSSSTNRAIQTTSQIAHTEISAIGIPSTVSASSATPANRSDVTTADVTTGSAIGSTAEETSVPSSTSTSGPQTPSPTTRPLVVTSIDVIYVTGHVDVASQPLLMNLVKANLTSTLGPSNCCFDVKLREASTFIDPDGVIVQQYFFNYLSNYSTEHLMGNDSRSTFYHGVDAQLQVTNPFDARRNRVYFGPTHLLQNLLYVYTLDVIDDVRNGSLNDVRKAILETWRNADRDCGCIYSVPLISKPVRFVGDYGMRLSRFYYTVAKDNETVGMTRVKAPEIEAFAKEMKLASYLPYSVYAGRRRLPFSQRRCLLISNSHIKMADNDSQEILHDLKDAWNKYLSANNGSGDGKDIEIGFVKPELHFLINGSLVANVDYVPFTKAAGTESYVDWAQYPGPKEKDGPPPRSPVFCRACSDSTPVFYAEVAGSPRWADVLGLGNALFSRGTSTSGTVEIVQRSHYLDADYGKEVTRLYLMPPVPGGLSAPAWSEARDIANVKGFRLLDQPLRQTFPVALLDVIKEEQREALNTSLARAWHIANSVLGIPESEITISSLKFDSEFYAKNGEGRVTVVTYTVTVAQADASLTVAEEPNYGQLRTALQGSPFSLCACTPLRAHQVALLGNVSRENRTELESALAKAWKEENPDVGGNLTVNVRYIPDNKTDGQKVTVVYTVSPQASTVPIGFTDLDLFPPTNKTMEAAFEDYNFQIYVQRNNEVDDTFPWYIPVGIVLGLLFLAIIVVIFAFMIRDRRRRESRNVKQNPAQFVDYDHEHFSAEPEFINPAYAVDDQDLPDARTGLYYVNMLSDDGLSKPHTDKDPAVVPSRQ